MKLELKHITPYLPYGLKFCNTSLLKTLKKNNQKYNPPILRVIDVNGLCWLGKEQDSRSLNDGVHKPILRPLSELKTFNTSLFTTYFKHRMDSDECFIYIGDVPYSDMEKLFNLHFDVFRLIENNLAIDINTLNK